MQDFQHTSYEELEQYIQAYQAGDKESGQRIVDSFEGFLTDYSLLIHKGIFNIQDRKMRDFVRLYMKGPQRRYIHQYKHKPKVRQELYRTASRVNEIFRGLEYNEIYQELVLGLLQLAKRYRVLPDKPRFHVYVMRTFHYEARRRLQNLFYYESAKTIKYMALEFDRDHDTYNEDMIHVNTESNYSFLINEYSTLEEGEEIDEEWILGWKTNEIFAQLTALERRIIKLYYWDDMSDQEVANQLGMCRVTINRYRLRAKEKIREKCDGLNFLKED